jgi:hypothetical protein
LKKKSEGKRAMPVHRYVSSTQSPDKSDFTKDIQNENSWQQIMSN